MTGWAADSARKPQRCRWLMVHEPHGQAMVQDHYNWAGARWCAARRFDAGESGGKLLLGR